MTAPTRNDRDSSTEEVLAQLGNTLAVGRDLTAAAVASLSAAMSLTGATGGEVVTVDEGTTMVPRASMGAPRGAMPATALDLPGAERPVGRLSLWGPQAPNHPALSAIASQLGLAVRAALSERDATRQREHTRRLAGAVRALRDVHPTEQAVLCMLREAQQLTGTTASALVTGLPGDPGPAVSVGIEPDLEAALPGLFSGTVSETLNAGNGWTGALPASSALASVSLGGFAVVPVGGPVERIGSLVVLCRSTAGLSTETMETLLGFADHATTALGSAALRERLNDLATVDPATRFFNSRYFTTRLEQESHRALRNSDTLALLVVRMDNLDEVRSSSSHEADKAVTALAEYMVPRLRATDIGCRTAPNEFALILPGAAGLDAYLIGERIRTGFGPEASLNWGITLSLGVATFPDPAGTSDQLDAFAHAAAEYARRNGSDRVFLYDRQIAADLDAADQRDRLNAETLLSTISSLAAAIDERHPTTRVHSQNVARISALIAEEMGFARDHVENVRLAGLLHDVGKIGVTDELLVRPGPLTLQEWEEMRQYPEMAHRMLSGARLAGVPEWVRCHQERPDGKGYPRGLSGDAIPVEAGIVAVANALDSMTNERPYRPAHQFAHALAELEAGSGTQFMPQVVDVVKAIASRGDNPLRPTDTP